jgi:hypothetical protein
VQFGAAEAFGSQLMEHFHRDPDTFRHLLVESLYNHYLVRQIITQITPLYPDGTTLYFYSSGAKLVPLSDAGAFRKTLWEMQAKVGMSLSFRVKLYGASRSEPGSRIYG